MKIGEVSKRLFGDSSKKLKNLVVKPVFLILVWFLALAISFNLSLDRIFFILTIIFAIAAILGFFILRRLTAVFLVSVLAVFFVFIFSHFAANPLSTGCRQVKIVSAIYSSGNKSQFLVSTGAKSAIVETAQNDNFGYSDQYKMCFEEKMVAKTDPQYSNFLKARFKTDFTVQNPDLEQISVGHGALRSLYDFAAFLKEKVNRLFVGNESSLAVGLLLGGSGSFSQDFKAYLQKSGTTHLVAVSGYNVSIITVMLFNFLRQVFSRRIAVASSVVVLIAFCIMTGAGASVVRASIMGGLYIFGKSLGRRSAVLNSLFVGGFIMTLINPYVLFDVGFQLSFLATLGLILLEKHIFEIFFARFSTNKYLIEPFKALSTTLSAQFFTFPVLLYSFGAVSIVAPLTNVLILPLVPLSMGLIAISLAASLIFFPLGLFVSGLTRILLSYFLSVIKLFGGLDFAGFKVGQVSFGMIISLYAVIFALAFILANFKYFKKEKPYFERAEV